MFAKIILFLCMIFKKHVAYNSRGAWHTQYVNLPKNMFVTIATILLPTVVPWQLDKCCMLRLL